MFVSLNQSILIMNSKEFSRNVSFYSVYNKALCQFLPVDGVTSIQSIWKIEIYGSNGERITDFASELNHFDDTYLHYFDVKAINVDKFLYSDFLLVMRFFKFFISNCSEYQMEVLRSDSRFINLLNFISNG